MRIALAGLGLAAAVRVVDRVHRRAANGRLDTAPALGTGLAELLEVVLDVADFTNGGAALRRHPAHLARAQAQRGVHALARDQLHASAGRARDLRALARLHLDAVHGGTDRDVAQRQRVAGLDRRVAARHQLVADGDALGSDDVAALAIGIAQQRDVRGAVGIVLDALDAAGDAFLVALEIDQAVVLLVATTGMTDRDPTMVVATAGLALRLNQRSVRRTLVQVRVDDPHLGTAARRSRLVIHQCHDLTTYLQALAITSMLWPSARRT